MEGKFDEVSNKTDASLDKFLSFNKTTNNITIVPFMFQSFSKNLWSWINSTSHFWFTKSRNPLNFQIKSCSKLLSQLQNHPQTFKVNSLPLSRSTHPSTTSKLLHKKLNSFQGFSFATSTVVSVFRVSFERKILTFYATNHTENSFLYNFQEKIGLYED
jgi:hypothetical protein